MSSAYSRSYIGFPTDHVLAGTPVVRNLYHMYICRHILHM